MTDFACKSLPFATPPLRGVWSRGGGTPRLSADVRHLYQKLPEGGASAMCTYSGLPQQCVEEVGEAEQPPAASPSKKKEKKELASSLCSPGSHHSHSVNKDEDSDAESVHCYEQGFSLDEDLYGVSIASFLRDMRKVITGHGNWYLRISRLMVTTVMMLGLVGLQFYLVIMMQMKVCPTETEHMQDMYDKYEVHMYGGHTTVTAHGRHRGVDGHFNVDLFESLDPDFQDEICAIPLTHPVFFSTMLLIWTMTVVADVRQLFFLTMLFMWRIRKVSRVYDIFEHDDEEKHGRPSRTENKRVVLVGLPIHVKSALFAFVFLPRLVLDVVLLWLGSTWLMSTDSLEEVFLNAVALEFILYLKDLLYYAVVPMRNKAESQELLIPTHCFERATFGAYLGAFVWLIISVVWVPLYVFVLQRVLPTFKWDVNPACSAYGK